MIEVPVSLTGDTGAVFKSALDLIGSGNTLTANEPKLIADGATITMLAMQERRSLVPQNAAPVIYFVLSIGRDVGVGVVSAYIYEKLGTKKDRIRLQINRRITEVDEGKITRIIEEEINRY